MNKEDEAYKTGVKHGIYFCAAIVLIFILSSLVCNATAADLTFVDRADLDAQVDSVLAVCDTTWKWKNDIWFSEDSLGVVRYIPFNSKHCDLKILIITCRRWAGLTVFTMPDSSRSYDNIIIRDSVNYKWEDPDGTRWRAHLWDQHPGKARLWWWEEE